MQIWKAVVDAGAVPLVASTVGAFLGALSALSVGYLKARSDRKAEERASYTKARLLIFWHINSLENLKCLIVDKLKEDPKWAEKLVLTPHPVNLERINFGSLEWMVGRKRGQLLLELYLAEQRYLNATLIFAERNRWVEKSLDKIKSLNPTDRKGTFEVEYDEGSRAMAINATRKAAEAIEMALAGLKELEEQLHSEWTKLFWWHRKTNPKFEPNLEMSAGSGLK